MGYSSSQAKAFINQIAPIISKVAKERGYKVASPIIAQAILESAAGTSGLAKYHNYFGMKCGNSWKGKSVNMATKEEYTPGTLTNIKANFRAYNNMEEGVKGYFDFISSSRYANLKSATTPAAYLTMIKNDGYATSSAYVNNNMGVVNKYDLTIYDTFVDNNNVAAYPTIKIGSKGGFVRILQVQLGIEDDGIFGNKTQDAVKAWQKAHNLTVDGVVGPVTWKSLM